MSLKQQKGLYVQYGCGLSAPVDWQNFDISPTLRLQRIPLLGPLITQTGPRFPKTVKFGDIVKGLPVEEESCLAVYCSHVLEHLCLTDFRIALKNTYSYLKPGGTFRFVVPDLEYLASKYLKSDESDAALYFMDSSYLGQRDRPNGIIGFLRSWLGNSKHLWMWDYKSVEKELQDTGFEKIRRAQYGDSELYVFRSVEEAGRWQDCLGVECIRPLS